MNDINNWAISKQYLAAHYYLSEERPISISEAQRAQLGALHLHVSFGAYNPATQVSDLANCTTFEKKKRISEWKKLGMISRVTAMKKFIDLINSLFPCWYRFRKLYNEFENEWALMPQPSITKRSEGNRLERKEISIGKRKEIKIRESTPTAFKKIFSMQKERKRAKSRIVERAETPKIMLSDKGEKEGIVTKLPKIAKSFKEYQEKTEDFLKEFLEDLQSHRGGNIKNTSATKLPKQAEPWTPIKATYQIPYIDPEKQLLEYRKTLLSDEYQSYRTSQRPASFHQKKVIPNMFEKISAMKEILEKIENNYNTL